MQVADSIYEAIHKLKANQVGHILVVEGESVASTIGVVSKRDILVFMIKNFTTDKKIDVILDEKIGNLQIGTRGKDVVCLKKEEPLRQVFELMKQRCLPCIPVVDDDGVYQGTVTKDHIELLLRESKLHFVDPNL